MNLFDTIIDKTKNLLPCEGEVNYYGSIFTKEDADNYFEKLLHNIRWENDKAFIFGKLIVTKRKAAWYGSSDFEYTYSNVVKRALPWTEELLALKNIVEAYTNETFNSCLLNLYHDGNEGMAWHSDDEQDLQRNGAIASLSFGAERRFSFRHKQSKQTLSLSLEHGSLLVMKGATQTHWLHSLPKSRIVTTPRINLTFRTIV